MLSALARTHGSKLALALLVRAQASAQEARAPPLGARGALTARLDFAWRDEIYFRHFNSPLDRQRAFTRTDLSLRWDRGEEGAWAEIYVNNVEDRRKVKTGLVNEADHRQWFLAAPRMVGLRAGWRWRSEESPLARLGASRAAGPPDGWAIDP